MLDPKLIGDVDEATALGIATLWNDAMPLFRHALDHQVDDIDDGIRQALECDRDDCQTHDTRHREDDDACLCWACTHGGLLNIARDLRDWIDDLHAGAPIYGNPSSPDRLLSLATDWLHVNSHAPRFQVPHYHLGAFYRLLAELADQAKVQYEAYL
ncbi:hypothetical protein CJD44_14375 [Streptomyces sp. alain-838]|nr:hypothetical protein [Streptomyces sp. alain-838]PAK25808.1 hypothetical protein CJD44_14375 [Streptomyces sp. alain-838]